MPIEPKRILITGGTGFIGSHLIRRLIKENHSVHLLIRETSSLRRLSDFSTKLTLWPSDFSCSSNLEKNILSANPDIVFHLAGDTTIRKKGVGFDEISISLEVNLKGTLNLLQAIMNLQSPNPRLIRVGGLEEYGNGPIPFKETQRENPISPYSASQVAATYYSQMIQHYVQFPILTLRPSLVYGPAQNPNFFIPSFITSLLNSSEFEMSELPHYRDFIYVDDVIDALLMAMEKPASSSILTENLTINICSGHEYSIHEVAQMIQRLMGKTIKLRPFQTESRAMSLKHLKGSNERAKNLLHWSPKTSLEEGLLHTMNWFRNHSEEWARA